MNMASPCSAVSHRRLGISLARRLFISCRANGNVSQSAEMLAGWLGFSMARCLLDFVKADRNASQSAEIAGWLTRFLTGTPFISTFPKLTVTPRRARRCLAGSCISLALPLFDSYKTNGNASPEVGDASWLVSTQDPMASEWYTAWC